MNFFSLKLLKSRNADFFIQTAVSFTIRSVAALAGLILSIAVSRKLGSESAGLYFLAFSIITVLSAVSRVGLDDAVMRFTGAAMPDGEWGAVRAVVKRSLLLTLSISIPLSLALYGVSDELANQVFDKPDLADVFKGFSPGIVGLSVLTLLAMGLQGLRKIIESMMTMNIIVNFLVIASLIIWGLNTPEQAAWAYSCASLIAVAAGLIFYKKTLGSGDGNVSWNALFQSCFPIWVVVIMSQLTQYSGQFIAGAWVPAEEVAQLAVAQRTALLTSFILLAVNLVVAPRFASMYKRGEMEELEKLALTSGKLMIAFALPVVAVMLLFPEFVMSVFGGGFSEGAILLQILVIGQFINAATGSVGYLLTMSGHEKDYRNTVLISGPAAIGLAFILVPIYGAVGSAIATAVAISTQNLIAVYWVKRRLGFNTLAIFR